MEVPIGILDVGPGGARFAGMFLWLAASDMVPPDGPRTSALRAISMPRAG
jgi:hypothetical protein